MPIDYKDYPDNWKEVRTRILIRAGGEMPDPRVGARCEWCDVENYKPHPQTKSRVVLTVAHIDDPDPYNVDEDNLAALCQKCHNAYDAPMRARNRARNARALQVEDGQLELFDD